MIRALAMLALLAGASNPPNPYGTGTDATVNAQAIGFSAGWTLASPTSAAADALAGNPASLTAYLNASFAGRARIVTITRVSDDASDANLAICAQMGPSVDGGSNAPALSCPDVGTAGVSTGGCYLQSTGQSCTFIVRPQNLNCGQWTGCHVPLWYRASGGTGVNEIVHVAVFQ